MPKVTVLLPVFNGELYLREAIESVLRQTYSDFELLIADDASTDQSWQIIKDYAHADSRITAWTNATNMGLFANYNGCLRRASGEYIKPFAQDDLFEPMMLEKMLFRLENDKQLALVSCARRVVDEKGGELKILREHKEDTVLDFKTVVTETLLKLKNGIGEPATVMFRREHAGSGFDESFYHLGDIEYWLRIIEKGTYLYFDQVLCSFRKHVGSATNKNAKSLRFALDMLRLGKKYKAFLEQVGLNEEDYARMVADGTASHLRFLTRNEGISLPDLLAVDEESSQLAMNDMAGFKELLFYVLLIAAEAREENYSLKMEWEAERNRLEDEIAKLLKSRFWQLTVPLRGAVKALRYCSNASLRIRAEKKQ